MFPDDRNMPKAAP